MFIEDNKRKNKPEGTFTDPDKHAPKVIYKGPLIPDVAYEQITGNTPTSLDSLWVEVYGDPDKDLGAKR